MTSARKKPGAVFWTMVVVSLAMLYPVSFGPACWTSKGHRLPSFADQLLHWGYSPLADYAITESNPAATAFGGGLTWARSVAHGICRETRRSMCRHITALLTFK